MRVACPSCNAETSLEVLLGRESDARAVAAFIERHVLFGEVLVRYIALFRPEKRRLGIARMVALVGELLPDIERGAISRKGRDWAAPRDNWRMAMETVIAKRDKGTLTLPLTSHGLLHEVLAGLADKFEARTEAEREQDRKQRRGSGAVEPPRDLSRLAADIGTAPGTLGPPETVPGPDYSRPSHAALAIKAQMEAGLRKRAAAAPGEASARAESTGEQA